MDPFVYANPLQTWQVQVPLFRKFSMKFLSKMFLFIVFSLSVLSFSFLFAPLSKKSMTNAFAGGRMRYYQRQCRTKRPTKWNRCAQMLICIFICISAQAHHDHRARMLGTHTVSATYSISNIVERTHTHFYEFRIEEYRMVQRKFI